MTNVILDEKKTTATNNGNSCKAGDVGAVANADVNGKSFDKKNSNNDEQTNIAMVQPPPPDGGWGWIVVVASFLVHVVTDGVTYSFANFQQAIREHFHTSEAAAAWILSILVGVTLGSGPISSFFVNKYGCRLVTIAGSILASLCFLVSRYAPSVYILHITLGLGVGLGFGLIYLPAIVSVTVYFEKYRSLATGIAVCGSGVGTLILGPAIGHLVEHYEWQSTSTMVAILILSCIFFGLTFKPVEPVRMAECEPLTDKEAAAIENRNRLELRQIEEDRRLSMVIHDDEPPKYSDTKLDDCSSNNSRMAVSQPILAELAKESHVTIGEQSQNFARSSCGSGIMNRSDVFLRSSIHNIKKHLDYDSEENMKMRLSLRSLPNGTGRMTPKIAGDTIDDMIIVPEPPDNIFLRMLRFSLFRNVFFLLYAVSNFFTSIGFNVPYAFVTSYAQARGISKTDSTYLLSAIGLANTLGRIVLGVVSDRGAFKEHRLIIYNLCLTVCGIATALCYMCESYVAFTIYSSIFGFTSGAYVGLTSVCLVDLVGLDQLTNGFGLLLLFQGVASFLGAPMAGALKDRTGNFDLSFMLAGTMIAISGLMLFIIPPLQKRKMRMDRKNNCVMRP